MGTRLYRRFKILRGLRVNVGKSGVSISAGGRGANITVGKDGLSATLGAPGTGISHSEKISYGDKTKTAQSTSGQKKWVFFAIVSILACAIVLGILLS